MAKKPAHIPVLLFPLRLETRFIGEELWIRAFPDDILLESHNPNLSREELKAAKEFQQYTSETDQREIWERLVLQYGAYRAAYLVQLTDQELMAQTLGGSSRPSEDQNFCFRCLPERLAFYIYPKAKKQAFQNPQGEIPVGAAIPQGGLTVFGNGDEWMSDFELAVSKGMAIKISLPKDGSLNEIDRIIVTGIQKEGEPTKGHDHLKRLMANHNYHDGFSVLDYETPTNNMNALKSGYSSNDEYAAAKHFDTFVKGQQLEKNKSKESAAQTLSHALGLEKNSFEHIPNATLLPPSLNTLYQKATWYSLGANTLRMLFGDSISNEDSQRIWKFYANHVKARGPYPLLKVGNQPYAILPTMSIRNTSGKTQGFTKKMQLILSSLFEEWKKIAADATIIPRIDNTEDPFQTLIEMLSMQKGTSEMELNVMGYERIRGRLETWLQEVADVPSDLGRLSVGQVYELLEGREEIKGESTTMKSNYEKIKTALPSNVASTKQVEHAPILSFKEKKQYDLTNGALNIQLTEKDLAGFQEVLNQIMDNDREQVLHYQGAKGLSLFVDLLLRAYTKAVQRYHRIIYFKPDNAQLKTYQYLRVGAFAKSSNLPNGQAGNTITKGKELLKIVASKAKVKTNFSISIKTPLSGNIEQWYVKVGQTIQAGQPLCRILNKQKYEQIKKEIVTLGKQIITTIQKLPEQEKEKAQLAALKDCLDLNSYRLDAWITGLAKERIDSMRKSNAAQKGILTGVYGWVEHLKKDTEQTVSPADMTDRTRVSDGGIIHCPTPAQAMTATLFKNSFLSYYTNKDNTQVGGNPYAINLTSDRIQKSNRLMEGIRQDQDVEALLGYRLEKDLQEKGMQEVIYILRKHYPLEVNILNRADGNPNVGLSQLGVINGWKAIEEKDNLPAELNTSQKATVKELIGELENVLDGSLDNLFFEAAYQMAQGNMARSAAAMEASKGQIAPPETKALNTHISGASLQHKLTMLIPASNKTFTKVQAKAFIEPNLENWLENQFGSMDKIACEVNIYQGQEVSGNPQAVSQQKLIVKLSDLGLGYLDFIFLTGSELGTGSSELELRIWKVAQSKVNVALKNPTYKITDIAPQGFQSLSDAIELGEYILNLWANAKPLKSEDLCAPDEEATLDLGVLNQLKKRIAQIIASITGYQKDPQKQLSNLIQFNFPTAKRYWLQEEAVDVQQLNKEINQKLTAASKLMNDYAALNLPTEGEGTTQNIDADLFYNAFEILEKVAQLLFGKAFRILPPATASTKFLRTLSDSSQERLLGTKVMHKAGIGGQPAVQQWVQELAQVKNEFTAFEDWQMIQNVWQESIGQASKNKYKVAQWPSLFTYPWVGLTKKSIDIVLSAYPSNALRYKDIETGELYPLKSEGIYYPNGSVSTLLYLPDDLALSQNNQPIPQYGFVISSFSEHVPDEKQTTGLSFHYNAPNAEAPQALLLAAAADHVLEKGYWELEDLEEIIYDTLDLSKVRMVDLQALQKFGFVLPMTWWFNIPSVN